MGAILSLFNMNFDKFIVISGDITDDERYVTNCTFYMLLYASSFQYAIVIFGLSFSFRDIPIFLFYFLSFDAFVTLINSSLDSYITNKYIL